MNIYEQDINTSYRKHLLVPFLRAIDDYQLIQDGDHIMVCISGGKDSFLLAKCLQEYQRHYNTTIQLEFVVMNPGYTPSTIDNIVHLASDLEVPLHIYDDNIFDMIKDDNHPCFLCAKHRRHSLYQHAKLLSCNKIALGHHYNDVIETTMLSLLFGSQIKTMLPIHHSKNDITIIRPLYLVKEKDIISYSHKHDLHFIDCACLLSKKQLESKRAYVKQLIQDLAKDIPNVEEHIFKSMENVQLNYVLSYKDKQEL